MQPDTASTSKPMLYAGYIISGLVGAALLMSAAMKFIQPASMAQQMAEGNAKLGWSMDLIIPLGILELTCVILYIIPRTAVLGAILLTGYMGGAIATHVRVGDGFVPQIVIGVLIWLGLYFRDARVRALIPITR